MFAKLPFVQNVKYNGTQDLHVGNIKQVIKKLWLN